MINAIAFTVPGEPQGKGRARIGKVGNFARMFTPAKTVAYEGLIAHAAAQAMAGLPMFIRPCVLEVDAIFSTPKSMPKKHLADAMSGALRPAKKPDIDNIAKAVADGLNGVVWKDDVQAVEVRLSKRYGPTPGLAVRVAEL